MRKATKKTVVIPPRTIGSASGDGYETNMVINFVDRQTGNNMNAETGEIASTVTWADGAFQNAGDGDIVTGKWKMHALSGKIIISLPEIAEQAELAMFITDSASPNKDDVPTRSALYDPASGLFYSDLVPATGGRVR